MHQCRNNLDRRREYESKAHGAFHERGGQIAEIARQDKAKAYSRRKIAIFLIDLALSVVLLSVVQFSGLSLSLKQAVSAFSGNYYICLLLYLALLNPILYALGLPLTFYAGFILEHRFNLSNQTIKAWVREELKRCLLSFAISAMLVELFYAVTRAFPSAWWVIASLGYIAFALIFSKVFPVVIIPLFYKYKNIQDEALRRAILDLARRAAVKVTDAFEINMSKNTKKANAALVGWGDTRRIILADNLINEFSPEEVSAVVAHEIGHYKLRHIWKLILSGAASTFAGFYIFSLLAGRMIQFFRADGVSDFYMFPSVGLAFMLFNMVALPAHNAYSRFLERQADIFALRLTGSKSGFISVMEKLAEKNLSDTNPGRIIEFLFYDHPPISRRIESARVFEG